jgi:O-antigen/teichoic acid export membrane protein
MHGVSQAAIFSITIAATHSVVTATTLTAAYRITSTCLLDSQLTRHAARDSGDYDLSQSLAEILPALLRARRHTLGIVRTALPLASTFLILSLLNNCPLYYLKATHGEAYVGVFGILATLQSATATIAQSVNQASVSRLATISRQGGGTPFLNAILQILYCHITLASFTMILGIIGGEAFLTSCFGVEYSSHTSTLALILGTGLLHYAWGLLDTALIAASKSRLATTLALTSGVFTVCCCQTLIPQFGIQGAAVSAGIGKIPSIAIGFSCLILHRKHDP